MNTELLTALKALLSEAEILHKCYNQWRAEDGWDAITEDASLTTARALIAKLEAQV